MKQLSQGFLICIEGIDGSGKSSFSKSLYQELVNQKYQTLLTREPGGTPLGERVRAILFDGKTPPTPKAEFLLFAASRAQHCDEHIRPALASGSIVLSDRMADSSLVYQGYVRGLSLDLINSVNAWAMGDIKPHIIFYLHVDAHEALARIQARNVPGAAFEEGLTRLQHAIDGFEAIFSGRPHVIVLDANQSPQDVYKQGLQALQPYLSDLKLP
jgi:dTMP kinase